MVDLSDVIGKAIGGDEGMLANQLIDGIRKALTLDQQEAWTDTDVILALLYRSGEGGDWRNLTKVDVEYLASAKNKVIYNIDELQAGGYTFPSGYKIQE